MHTALVSPRLDTAAIAKQVAKPDDRGYMHALRQASAQPRLHSQSIREWNFRMVRVLLVAVICSFRATACNQQGSCHFLSKKRTFLNKYTFMQGHWIPEAAAGAASGLPILFLDSFCLTGLGRSEAVLPCWGCSWRALEAWKGS